MAGGHGRDARTSVTAPALGVVLLTAVVTLVVLWLTAGTSLSIQRHPAPVDALAAPPPRAVATPVSSEASGTPPLAVHAWVPRSVRIGADRQLRVQVGDSAAFSEDRLAEHLRVTFASDDPRFTVLPADRILTRAQLPDARFVIAARADLTCADAPAGALVITVTSLLDPDRTASTQVALPEPDCRDAPPEAPDSVHVTDAVCGDDHADQVRRILEGDELDPRRCASHRWRDGEPRPWPPPRPSPPPPTPPPAPSPPPEADPDEDPDTDPEDDPGDAQPPGGADAADETTDAEDDRSNADGGGDDGTGDEDERPDVAGESGAERDGDDVELGSAAESPGETAGNRDDPTTTP